MQSAIDTSCFLQASRFAAKVYEYANPISSGTERRATASNPPSRAVGGHRPRIPPLATRISALALWFNTYRAHHHTPHIGVRHDTTRTRLRNP